MGNLFGHRRIARLALGAGLVCAPSAFAQEAPAEPSLTGIPDIEFSLPVRPTENPGTPSEGRSLRPAAPSEPVAATTAPSATPAPDSAPQAEPDRAPPEPVRVRRTGPSETAAAERMPAEGEETVANEATLPESGTVQPFDVSTANSAADAGSSGIPAWPFGLALLALVTWLAFGRRRRGAEQGAQEDVIEPAEPAPGSLDPEAEMAPGPEPSPPARAMTPPSEAPEPVASPAKPETAHRREAHPALRVKVPEPAPAQPSPPPPPAPPVTLYDAFGRPIVAGTVQSEAVAKPAPTPQASPGAKVVRYDAMGLPIRD